MRENDPKISKTEYPDNRWKYLTKKPAYPYEYFNCLVDYQKPVNALKKENFFSKLKNKGPSDEEIERTKKFFEKFNTKNGEELTQLYFKSDVLLLTCAFQKFIEYQLMDLVSIHYIVLVYLVLLGNVV